MKKSELYSILFIPFIVGLGFLSNYYLHRVDTKALLETEEEKYPESFIGSRAYSHLKKLNDLGPKVSGSRANEVLAVNFIYEKLLEIKSNASNPDDIRIDHQISSGILHRINYINLQNIIVRLQGEADHALMLNCHFDSVSGSPGASDDSVNCCIMMEILRVLSKSSKRQKHTIIFLFNGSEETGLQASHAFITQQKWRESVQAFINLESTGSGGREIMFRTGPKHDWLVKMYRESVPRPFGQVISEELFEIGVIPAGTDFEIFRDYGEIPGLDFAYVENGWRYHTRYDSIDYISIESIQQTGNNILELTKKIANSKELANPPEGTHAIYFDYLGLFFISYTATVGQLINYIVSVLAIFVPILIQTKFMFENAEFVFFETIISFMTFVLSIILSGFACYVIAELMHSLDNTMSWFNATYFSFGIYCTLTVIVQLAVYHFMQFLSKKCFKRSQYHESFKKHHMIINMNGVSIFWAILIIYSTTVGFRSPYICMELLFLSICTNLSNLIVFKIFSKATKQCWILIHTIGHSISFINCSYLCLQILQLFIPIAGKIYINNPDIIIAGICNSGVVICLSYFIPLSILAPKRKLLYIVLSTIFIASTILSFTHLGFPYSGDNHAPRVQRFHTIHIKRTYFDQNGNAKSYNNNVIIYPTDKNGIRTIEKAFNERDFKLFNNDVCREYMQCGIPDYKSFLENKLIIFQNFNSTPNIQPTKFNLIRSSRNGKFVDIEFTLELISVVHFEIVLNEDLTYMSSNIGLRSHIHKQTQHLIGRFISGKRADEPYLVKIALYGTPTSDVFARLNLITEDSTFDQGKMTPEFENLLDTFPNYAFSTAHQIDSSFYEISQI